MSHGPLMSKCDKFLFIVIVLVYLYIWEHVCLSVTVHLMMGSVLVMNWTAYLVITNYFDKID